MLLNNFTGAPYADNTWHGLSQDIYFTKSKLANQFMIEPCANIHTVYLEQKKKENADHH